MKQIGRGLVLLCMAALLSVGARAASGGTTFEIEVNPKITLDILVIDDARNPVENVLVNLVDPDHPGVPPINGSNGVYTTNGEGKIQISMFRSDTQNYRIVINHAGYERYESETFQMTASTSKIVQLKRNAGSGEANYYYVYYHAAIGGSVGLDRERVREGGSPEHVPAPKPDAEYTFTGWYLNGVKVDNPSNLVIQGRTDLYARFEKKPVVTPSPTVSPNPNESPRPTVPAVSPTPAATPSPGVSPRPTNRPAIIPGQVGGGGDDSPGAGGWEIGTGPIAPPAAEGGSIHPGQPVPPSQESNERPTAPLLPEAKGEAHICWLHWLILLCALTTALFTALRIHEIKKQLRERERKREQAGTQTPV